MTLLMEYIQAMFFALLSLSTRATIAALAVAAAAWLLRKAGIPRAVTVVLWLVVLVRMLCPMGVPVQLPDPTQEMAQAVLSQVATVKPPQSISGQPMTQTDASYPAARSDVQTLCAVAALVWLVVACGLLLRAARQAVCLRRSVRQACKTQAPDGTVYYSTEKISVPFLLGIFRPRIYLPAGLSGSDRRAVLAHEQAHRRRCDHILRPVFYGAACLHWFNPAVWLAFRGFCGDTEAACDEAALRTLGEAGKGDYCRALLKFARVKGASLALTAFAPDDLTARIAHILTWKLPRRRQMAAGVVLAALTFTACMAQPQVQSLPSGSDTPVIVQPDTQSEVAGTESKGLPESVEWTWPVPGFQQVSCWQGQSHENGTSHCGVDITAPGGTSVVAAADGVVTAAEWDAAGAGSGYALCIDHGDGTETVYAHCRELLVAAGDVVTAGQVVATIGSTGRSTGNHLHWEVRVDGESIPPQELFPEYAG